MDKAELYLRKEIRQRLLEFDGGDYGMDIGDIGGAYGGGYSGSLYNIFVKPFTDVGKVALASIEDVTSKGRAVIETAIKGITSLALLGFSAEYNKIKNAEKQRAQNIKQKYADVFKDIDDAFKGDALGFAFMLAPSQIIAGAILKKSAVPLTKTSVNSLLSVIDTASGRLDTVTNLTDKVRSKLGLNEAKINENLLFEDKNARKKISSLFKQLLQHPDVKKALTDSKLLINMKEDTESMISKTLMNMIDLTTRAMDAKNLQELGNILKKDIIPKELKQIEDVNVKQKLENSLLTATKQGLKNVIVKTLEEEAEKLIKQGIAKGHPYVVAYQRAIEKVNSQ